MTLVDKKKSFAKPLFTLSDISGLQEGLQQRVGRYRVQGPGNALAASAPAIENVQT